MLLAMKVNAYSVTASEFCNYFHMGESTMHKRCKCFNKAIAQYKELTAIYLQKMTKANARRVSQLHFIKHGIHGMLGCLDCM